MTRRFISMLVLLALALSGASSAYACTMLYVGGELTEDGANMFSRSEDYYENDFNKLYYVSPAGQHVEGEVYQGCYGFTWTFTHDSYRYTARRDDNSSGVCPDCGGTHAHTPYEEAGTNECGVTVSATETLYGNDAVAEIDPYTDNGIEEAEITTILLSEAASAREGVELLMRIYDGVGANAGAGLVIADQSEQWYVENMSGHQYIAVKLPANVAFLQPNLSVLGEIALDDSENVLASADVIAVAQQAGTFVGDAERNVIDFRASYANLTPGGGNDNRCERLANGLNYLTGTDVWTAENVLSDNDAIVTNIDGDGGVCALHNELVLKEAWSVEGVFGLYRVYPIGYEENENIHIYQFYPEAERELGTVEWSTMDDGRYNAYVPSFPMLLTDTWEGFMASPGEVTVVEEAPESGDCYEKDGAYYVYPEGWEQSYFWTLNALSNALTYGGCGEEAAQLAQSQMAGLQEEFAARFAELRTEISAASEMEARQQLMTDAASEMSEQVHDLALALYRYITSGEGAELFD